MKRGVGEVKVLTLPCCVSVLWWIVEVWAAYICWAHTASERQLQKVQSHTLRLRVFKGRAGDGGRALSSPVKQTGHLKVPPIPSKLCSIRWQSSLAGESNIWLHSLHSWLMPSSANRKQTHARWSWIRPQKAQNSRLFYMVTKHLQLTNVCTIFDMTLIYLFLFLSHFFIKIEIYCWYNGRKSSPF